MWHEKKNYSDLDAIIYRSVEYVTRGQIAVTFIYPYISWVMSQWHTSFEEWVVSRIWKNESCHERLRHVTYSSALLTLTALYPQKSPALHTFIRKSPVYPQKSPAYPQKSPTLHTFIRTWHTNVNEWRLMWHYSRGCVSFDSSLPPLRSLHPHLCYGLYVWMNESSRVISECIMSHVLYARPRHRLHSPDCLVWFCDVLFDMIYIMLIWMSLRLVTMNQSLLVHVWMSRVMSRMNESCHVTYKWVVSCHIWMSLAMSHMNESCHVTSERDMLDMNESCRTCTSHATHLSESRVTHVNVSCHTYEEVMSHTCIIHVIHVHGSCHTRALQICYTYAAPVGCNF